MFNLVHCCTSDATIIRAISHRNAFLIIVSLMCCCPPAGRAAPSHNSIGSPPSTTPTPSAQLTIPVQQYDAGTTAVLSCDSNDDNHNFMFWQLSPEGDVVVGPGNYFDSTKYKYDVLTGQLFIKNVSPSQTGLYKCVSRGVKSNDLKIRSVELVVQKDWEDVYDNDTDLNLLRALMGMTVLLLVLGVGFVLVKMRKRLPHRYLGRDVKLLIGSESSDDEDSAEEVFTSPKVPKTSTSSSKSTKKSGNIVLNEPSTSGLNKQPEIETDFHAVFATLNTSK